MGAQVAFPPAPGVWGTTVNVSGGQEGPLVPAGLPQRGGLSRGLRPLQASAGQGWWGVGVGSHLLSPRLRPLLHPGLPPNLPAPGTP